jgi:hypothetical protein
MFQQVFHFASERAKTLILVFASALGLATMTELISVTAQSEDSCVRPPQRVISSESRGRSVLPLWRQLSQCNVTLKYIDLGSLPIAIRMEWLYARKNEDERCLGPRTIKGLICTLTSLMPSHKSRLE